MTPFELLADASASLDRFSEMERDARIMADASSRLFEKKPAKWNRRRLFKSHVYQALGLYHNGKDPEPVLEAAYREYRELDEDAWAEQKVLAHLLYEMYIQVLLEKAGYGPCGRAVPGTESPEGSGSSSQLRCHVAAGRTLIL